MNANEKRHLRNLFQGQEWAVVQKALKEYKEEQFFNITARRDSQFNTLWDVAHREGGKDFLDGFMSRLETLAND